MYDLASRIIFNENLILRPKTVQLIVNAADGDFRYLTNSLQMFKHEEKFNQVFLNMESFE